MTEHTDLNQLVADPEERDVDAVERELFRSAAALERQVATMAERVDALEAEWLKRLDRWGSRIEKCHKSQVSNDEITDGLARRVQALENTVDWITRGVNKYG